MNWRVLLPFRSLGAGPVLRGKGVLLRPPVMDDFKAWAALRQSSRAFLEPWEPVWSDHDFTKLSFRQRLKIYREWAKQDRSHSFFIFKINTNELIGAINLSNIRRGAEQSASTGYWVGERFTRQGHMFEALQLLLVFAFEELNLHRVEAACLPRNHPSQALLEKSGFVREGYAKSYIKIADQWEDHVLFARLKISNSESQSFISAAKIAP